MVWGHKAHKYLIAMTTLSENISLIWQNNLSKLNITNVLSEKNCSTLNTCYLLLNQIECESLWEHDHLFRQQNYFFSLIFSGNNFCCNKPYKMELGSLDSVTKWQWQCSLLNKKGGYGLKCYDWKQGKKLDWLSQEVTAPGCWSARNS